MALSIKDPETERLARALAERITAATRKALEERLRRVGSDARKSALIEDLAASRRRWSAMPVVDPAAPTRSSVTTKPGCQADGHRHIRNPRHCARRTGSPCV